jgi:hypothetical protein
MSYTINDKTMQAKGGPISKLTRRIERNPYMITPGIMYKLDVGPVAKLYSTGGNTQLVVITGYQQSLNWGHNAEDFPTFATTAYTFHHPTPMPCKIYSHRPNPPKPRGKPNHPQNNRLKPTSARCMLFYDMINGFATLGNIPDGVDTYVFSLPEMIRGKTHYDMAAQIAIDNCTDPRLRAWWAAHQVRIYAEIKNSVPVTKPPVEFLPAQCDDILAQANETLSGAQHVVTVHTNMLMEANDQLSQLVNRATSTKADVDIAITKLVAVVKVFPWDPKELMERRDDVLHASLELDLVRVQLTALRHVVAKVDADAIGVTEAKAYIEEYGTSVAEAIAVLQRAATASKKLPGLTLPSQTRFIIDEADEHNTMVIENNMTRIAEIASVVSTAFPDYRGESRLMVTRATSKETPSDDVSDTVV